MPRERHCLWSANVFSWRLQGQKRGITGLLRDTCSERLECQRERGNDLDLLKETWMPRERYRFRSAQRDLNAKRKVSFSLAYIADCFVSWFRQGVWRKAGLADVLARTAEPGLLQSNLRQDNRSACVIEYMLHTVQLALFHVKLFSFWNIWIFSQNFSFLHGNRQIYARRFIQYIDLYCYYSEKKINFLHLFSC